MYFAADDERWFIEVNFAVTCMPLQRPAGRIPVTLAYCGGSAATTSLHLHNRGGIVRPPTAIVQGRRYSSPSTILKSRSPAWLNTFSAAW